MARFCGVIAMAFGLLALLGWAVELPFLATFGADRIPMAPSTAALFVLYGIAVALRARRPFGRGARGIGAALIAAGASSASLLLVLSFLGIHPDAELLGFVAPGPFGETPVGHMSPVVASCFLLASLSFLAALPSAARRSWRGALVARWTAGFLLATGCLLVLAYLFGGPLFYGGSFTPPAATTSLALVALGVALLALAGRPVRLFRPLASATAKPRRGVPRRFVLVVVLLALGIAAAGGLYSRASAQRYRAAVEHELSFVADLKARELTLWRAERRGDAAALRGTPVFPALVRDLLADPPGAEAPAQLRTWLTHLLAAQSFDQISLLDSQGNERLVVPAGRGPVAAIIAGRLPEILHSAGVTFEDFYRDDHDGRIYLSLLVPIRDERSRALGMVVLTIDPEHFLFPFLQRWPTPAQTAESLLIRQDGFDALFANQPKSPPDTAPRRRVPLANPGVIFVKTSLGQDGVVEGRDDRGVQVLAAFRPIPDSPWMLVARIDAAEANAPLRERLWEMIALVGALLAAAVAGAAVVWREIRVRDLRGRFEADQERAWLHDVVARSLNEVYVFDPETLKFRFVNRGACENLGYTPEELADLTPLDIKPGFTAETFRALLEPLRAAERAKLAFESLHRRKDGSDYPVEVHLQLVDSGGKEAFLGVVDDITVRRRAETHIRQLNRVYALLSAVNQSIVRLRAPQALFAEACRVAVETGGFRMAWIGLVDVASNSLRPVAHAGVTDGYLENLRIPAGGGDDPRGRGPTATALREGRHSICNDIEHDPAMSPWRDDALKLGYHASAAFPLIVKGETLGTFNLYAAEPEFFDAKEVQLLDELATDLSFAMEIGKLEETRRQLATAIAQLPVAVTITDAEGRIEYVNPAFSEITGYTAEEALGGNPRMLKSGRQSPELYQELWATIRAGQSWRGELVNRRKDGGQYHQELTIAPVRDAEERVTHFISISVDVTARKNLETELRQSQKIEAIGRLAGGVAHDFNNILGVILGYGELAKSEVEAGTPVFECVTEMIQAAERAATLTRQLQAFSRKQILQPRRVDLNERIAEARKMLDRVIGEDIQLVVLPAPERGTVLADPGQIDQILLNLAINARDAMPSGGTLTLEIAQVELDEEAPTSDRPAIIPGRYVVIAVSDTGVGMDAETQRRIFEPFFTTKPAGQGTGLGLATVYGIVKQSGGYIWVYSEPGLGTTFKVCLPRIDELPDGDIRVQPTAKPAGGRETILLVEDNLALRDSTRRQLEAAGYTVLLAGDGEEAQALAEAHGKRIDLLLTDVVMPKLGGGELARRLTALRPGLPVLFMSGYTDGAITHHGVLADDVALLEKPFSGERLVQAVRAALDRPAASALPPERNPP